MTGRRRSFTWREPIQRWLFVGTLLFATLAVPGIALVTRVAVGPAEFAGPQGTTSAAGARAAGTEPSLGGGGNCQAGLAAPDSMLIADCPLKR